MKKILKKIKPIVFLYNKYLFLKSDFHQFENRTNKQTWQRHSKILKWADNSLKDKERLEAKELYLESKSPIVKQGFKLREKVLKDFKDKYSKYHDFRILIHLPSAEHSPAGYSLFRNLLVSMSYIGIPATVLNWNESIEKSLKNFKPTVFITSDDDSYLDRINWKAVSEYRKNNKLKIGLTASLEEYGNTPLIDRLEWAKKNGIDFYYSYAPKEYIDSRDEYKPFFDYGYKIFNVEFGANPLIHYPVPNIERDLNFVFLASSNNSKWDRYFKYLEKIFVKAPGFIHGPGWSKLKDRSIRPDRDRYLYSRGRIGINLHLQEQIEWDDCLNERTYMLAACGTPQLIDNPKLLFKRFSKDAVFSADNPDDYYDLFEEMLVNVEEAEKRALKAQKEAFTKHTTFHRAEKFVLDLKKHIIK